MTRKLQPLLSFFILVAAVFWGLYGNMPQDISSEDRPADEFSTARAFEHVEAIAQQPHYIGSAAHSEVRNYIVSELQEMGLLVHTQETYTLNNEGTITRPQNIISRIEGSGSGKALLLLTHYDSAVHSSFGASDAASGVATILEGVRAFLASGQEHTNDIILVFTDGEEVGLNGAEAFVNEHEWAEDVGLALNFEARGSGGNSFMLLETNTGNEILIDEFIKAGAEFPVTNSLAYSVYKMLPNDTDLTVLREQGDIPGFNFAFVDDHFDYHTATDVPENLDKNTLEHQGSYLMPLLSYFSNRPLESFASSKDYIYFNLPVLKMVNYPFAWNLPLLLVAFVLFIALVIYGFLKKRLRFMNILKGFVPLLISVIGAGLLSYLFWQFCLFIYPQYREMEHGFTYNGYLYIAAVIFLALGICFATYQKFRKSDNARQLFVAPIFLWILISAGATFFLKGAAYFVIPVFFALLQLFLMIKEEKPNLVILALLSLPAIFIVLPFMVDFPVALGLKILFVAAVLTALLWVLLLPVFGFYTGNQSLAFFSYLTFFILVVVAHFSSEFNEERPKPNSLVYVHDADAETATWNTYDNILDPWTTPYFGEDTEVQESDVLFSSKYNSGFTETVKAPAVELQEPFVDVQKRDSLGEFTEYSVKIAPNRNISRMELFADRAVDFEDFRVNGLEAEPLITKNGTYHVFKKRWSNRLLTYYAVNNDTLRLDFTLKSNEKLELTLYGASHDLLENPDLGVPQRTSAMIPRPFVLNDAVVVKKKISLE